MAAASAGAAPGSVRLPATGISRLALSPARIAMLGLFGLMTWGPPRLRFDLQHWSVSRAGQVAWNIDLERPTTFDFANSMHLAVWCLAGLVAALAVGRQPRAFLAAATRLPMGWYFLYGIVGVASAVYSPNPGYTLYFGALIPIGVIWVFLIRSKISTLAPLQVIYVVHLCVWGVLAALYVVAPQYVGEPSRAGYRLTGGTFNDYGQAAVLSGLFCLSSLVLHRDHRRPIVVLVLFFGYLCSWLFVLLSHTRVTMAGGLGMAVIVVGLSRRRFLPVVVALGTLATLALMGPLGLFDRILSFLTRGEPLSTIGTFTGRTFAFQFLLDQWRESPWVGYGYGAGSRQLMTRFILETGLGMGSAHDALSRSLADLGLIGAGLLLAGLLHSWIALFHVWRSSGQNPQHRAVLVQATALLFWVTFRSAMSTGIATLSIPFIVAVTIIMDVQRREQLSRMPQLNGMAGQPSFRRAV